jgi:hypothetical protein
MYNEKVRSSNFKSKRFANNIPEAESFSIIVFLPLFLVSFHGAQLPILACLHEISGYGTDEPYAVLPTYDIVLQGTSGIADLTIDVNGGIHIH